MANLLVKDGADASKYLKTSGAGSDGDPHIPQHLETNSAALLTAAQAIQTAVEILDNVVSGSEAQVDVVSGTLTAVTSITNVVSVDDNAGSLTVDNAGTFATQATLQANSGVDIGDVDVTSVVPGTGATNLGKAEDSAHTTGDVGVMALSVRNDADASLAGTTGDYTPLQVDANGYLKVNIKAGAGSGGTAMTDDSAFTVASTSITPVGGVFTTDTVDAGDAGALAMDASRRLLVSIEADNVGIGGGTQYTEGATDATITGTAILLEGAGDALVVAPGTAADGQLVNLGSNNDVTVTSGAITETNSAAIKTAVELIDNAISGSEMQVDVVASLPAGTNNIGDVDVLSVPRSISGPAEPGTAVDSLTSVAVDVAASQTAASLISAPGASKQIWVYGLHLMADTAAGTVLLQDSTPANLTGTMAVSDEGGWVLPLSGNFSMPWFKCATNTALQMDNGACTVDGIITYAVVSV